MQSYDGSYDASVRHNHQSTITPPKVLEHYARTFTLVDRSWPTKIEERFGFDIARDVYFTVGQSTAIVAQSQYSNLDVKTFLVRQR